MSDEPGKVSDTEKGRRCLFITGRVVVTGHGARHGTRVAKVVECATVPLATFLVEVVEKLDLLRDLNPDDEPLVLGEVHFQFTGFTDTSYTLAAESST